MTKYLASLLCCGVCLSMWGCQSGQPAASTQSQTIPATEPSTQPQQTGASQLVGLWRIKLAGGATQDVSLGWLGGNRYRLVRIGSPVPYAGKYQFQDDKLISSNNHYVWQHTEAGYQLIKSDEKEYAGAVMERVPGVVR